MRIVFDFIYTQITYVIATNAKLTATTKMFTISNIVGKGFVCHFFFTEFELNQKNERMNK